MNKQGGLMNTNLIKALRAKADGRFAAYMKTLPPKERVPDYWVLMDAADALEAADKRAKELEEAQRWIPVAERLPEPDKIVLCYNASYNSIETGHYDHKQNKWSFAYGRITHWQPLPQPPQKG